MKTKNDETWGCEFLDVSEPKPFKLTERYPNAVWLPVGIIERITDTAYQGRVLAEGEEKIRDLAEQINREGLREPGLIIYNEVNIKLQDGNHRFLACTRHLGWDKFWVEARYKRGAITNGHAVGTVVLDVINGIGRA